MYYLFFILRLIRFNYRHLMLSTQESKTPSTVNYVIAEGIISL
ncbi:MAG: hypothetical protein UHM85_08855 [Acutalibacteraceae bacterium]|nr:hypothetical protein [Acutalibacteraceae bacterium]